MFEKIKRSLALAKGALQHEKEHPKVKRESSELEFLPAAVETLESPPSAFAHILMLIICLILVFVLAWCWFSFIDTEATAEGRIIPVGQVKIVQSLLLGRVEEILIKEGEFVQQGQLLIKLDPTESQVDVKQTRASLLNNQLNAGRLQHLLSLIPTHEATSVNLKQWFARQSDSLVSAPSEEQWQVQQNLFDNDLLLYTSTKEALDEKRNQFDASIAAAKADLHRLQVLQPLYEEHERGVHKMLDHGHVSRFEWLAAREKQVDISQQRLVQQNRLNEAMAGLAATQSEQKRIQQEFIQIRMEHLNEFQEHARELELVIIKTNQRDKNCYILSPVTGFVQQLQVHTTGAVVEPAQTLMMVIPQNTELQVEANMPNKDIGFIREGMQADIKIETFPYTFYGSLSGHVNQVSRDAIAGEAGLVYPVHITLDQQFVRIDGHEQPLQVDMAVTAEVKTGKRRLLGFFMDPFLRYRDEALSVR